MGQCHIQDRERKWKSRCTQNSKGKQEDPDTGIEGGKKSFDSLYQGFCTKAFLCLHKKRKFVLTSMHNSRDCVDKSGPVYSAEEKTNILTTFHTLYE